MYNNNLNINDVVGVRNAMLMKEQELYVQTVEQINMKMKELVTQDLGASLVEETAHDLCGEVARRYFDTSEYYVTVDQLYDRFVNFTYDNDIDPLSGSNNIKKEVLNMNNAEGSEQLKEVCESVKDAQQKLFTEDRAQDKLDREGKKAYHEAMAEAIGQDYDELTGEAGSFRQVVKNGKIIEVSDMQADHIQTRNGATYADKYIRQEGIEELKKFYNSPDNFQMIHASANTSKGDIAICEDANGNRMAVNVRNIPDKERELGTKLTDITYRCSAEEIADATIAQWEKETPSGHKIETLKEKGYLDNNGKVKPGVREKLVANIEKSQNAESKITLKNADYGKIATDAGHIAVNGLGKILAGQVIYYAAPPMIYECKSICKKKNMSLDKFIGELPKAGKRVIKYVVAHLKDIFKNITKNLFNNFVKVFFDLIIEMVKATVKKLVKIVKELVMSLVNCIKTMFDSSKTKAEKAQAITKILAVTITGVVVELIFEMFKKGLTTFGIPPFLIEPLQILVTVIATSSVMFILQKMDLFNVRYGLLTANIAKMFDEENGKYLAASQQNYYYGYNLSQDQLSKIQTEINGIGESIAKLDIYTDDVLPYLQRINQIFDMQIDFEKEWNEYIG